MNAKPDFHTPGSSFRDPSGFIFFRNGTLYRQVNNIYAKDYDYLMNSGLYRELTERKLLLRHKEQGIECAAAKEAYKLICPDPIPFISYPYEWCFNQLKNAALITLEIQKLALKHGMTLKDCSAYNVQFIGSQPIFIDTLSFAIRQKGSPWAAYRQFCQHFLCPLVLMSYVDIGLSQLLKTHIDGLPLDLTSRLLPLRTYFNIGILLNIHFHSKAQKHYAAKAVDKTVASGKFSDSSMEGLLDNLYSLVKHLKLPYKKTTWSRYYEEMPSYNVSAISHKEKIVSQFLDKVVSTSKPKIAWDVGANTGVFSRIISQKGIYAVSSDIDPLCVEINYRSCLEKKENDILPLVVDLTNPSPAIGWDNYERDSFTERGPAPLVLALALMHHLAISNNIPLDKIAGYFYKISEHLIIEFIPKSDLMVKRLLASREDIFINYTQKNFENEFGKLFKIESSAEIENSDRIIYLMKKKV